jgi:GT2 family glycosyltransferase
MAALSCIAPRLLCQHRENSRYQKVYKVRFLDITLGQPTFFDPQSAWLRHGPFAMWLVSAFRPKKLVELGTHNGFSYFAFCQAVQEQNLETSCVAVDTWQGDEHAGFYDGTVYEAVSHHNTKYSDFSTLLRKTFDAALEDIEDGAVDLLHVDGRHFYDDVKADFESWIPKLSSRAIVLFHDTEVRGRGFGVWKYWEEISISKPALNFPHQHGLGVLFWGAEVQKKTAHGDISRLLELLDTDGGREAIIATFMLAGEETIRQHIFGDSEDLEPGQIPSLVESCVAELSKARQEQAVLSDQLADLTQKLLHAQERLARARENDRRQQQWLGALDAKLRKAQRKPWKLLGELAAYRLLKGLSRATPPLPKRTTERFARSAQKRNPKRSHLPFANEGVGSLAAPKASLEELREQVRKSSEANLENFLASSEQIVLPAPETPQVTVILVLWNQAPLTLACLQSLAEEVSVPIEVIIVDNASTDRTSELLGRIRNANILHQSENVGFLRGVNAALPEIRGGHVLLLNNDATLRHGTLAATVETMNSAPDIGAVGGPIILPNGALQEAGSIIWRDGSCLGYGRHDDPSLGSYMFRREVDYCSGAFLMIRDGLFQEMEGFDEIYAPAYYEETDLCMRIRASGYRILYDPRAATDHFEFGSLTKKSTAHEWQSKNREKFREKHARALATQHLPPAQENILAARMRDNRPRILFIEDRVPLRDVGAGLPRANEILQAIVNAGFFVTFLPATHPHEEWSDIWSAVPKGVEVATKVGLGGLEQFLEDRAGYYQQIFISRPHNMTKLVSIIKRRPALTKDVRIIYDAEAIFASRTLCKAELFGDEELKKTALNDRQEELALAAYAQHVTAVNKLEAESFQTVDGPTVTILGHTLPVAPTPARFEHRPHIVFLGNLANEDSPNVDSYVWFVDDVMPLLGDLFADQSKFLVAGRNSATSVHIRQTKEIELLVPVPELETLFDQAKVFVAPTRYAAGIPHKVHQAASLGVPIVATSLLAHQLGWEHEKHLLVADTADAFAAAIQRLFSDAKLWLRLREAALQKVSEECNPEEFRKDVLRSIAPAMIS